jgi:hypothetical protein
LGLGVGFAWNHLRLGRNYANPSHSEEPETFHFLAARDTVPLKSEFKPALKVLSRKPTPKTIQRIDPATGLISTSFEEEDEEMIQTNRQTPEELRLKAQKEREEKQRRYDEARARIMGTSSASGGTSPGAVTPPNMTEGAKQNWGRGRGKDLKKQDVSRPGSQSGVKELYDPDYTPKQAVNMQKRNGGSLQSGHSTPKHEESILRLPRGPDGSGRGGFASRGGKKG